MSTVTVQGPDLVVEVNGLDKLWAFTSRLTISLAHVRGATADPGIVGEPKGWRGPGTHVPGVLVAGRFHQDGETVFWDVHDRAKAVVVELADEKYRRLVVQVDDPRATVELVEQALGRTGS